MRRPYRDPDPDPAGILSQIWGDWRLHGLADNPPPRPDLYPSDHEAQHNAEAGYRAGIVERERGPSIFTIGVHQ